MVEVVLVVDVVLVVEVVLVVDVVLVVEVVAEVDVVLVVADVEVVEVVPPPALEPPHPIMIARKPTQANATNVFPPNFILISRAEDGLLYCLLP